jgi:hypothetical protein
MSEQDKQPYARQDKKIPRLTIGSTQERKKFEVLYQNWTPYKHLGSWLQFIWRF